jgi:hypothetical protein
MQYRRGMALRTTCALLALGACGASSAAPDAAVVDGFVADGRPDARPALTSIRIGASGLVEAFGAIAIACDGTIFAAGTAEGGAGATDGFVATFDAADRLLHARALGTGEGDGFLGAAPDGAGAILVGSSGDAQALGIALHVDSALAVTNARALGGSKRTGGVPQQGGQLLRGVAQVTGGFIAVGDTYPTGAAAGGASWILALDDQLATRWERAIDDGVDRTGASAIAGTGVRAVVGSYAHPTATTTVMRISALDDQTTTVTPAWLRQLDPLITGGTSLDSVTAIARASAGGYWIAGVSKTGAASAGQIVQLDAGGALLHAVRLDGVTDPILRAVVPTADGGCVVAGEAGGFGLIAKLDASAQITWQQAVGTGAISSLAAAALAPDGDMVFVGSYGGDAWFLRISDLAAAPSDFGAASTADAVVETVGSTTTGTTHAATWAATTATWAPTSTDLSALPIAAAP